MVHKNISDIKTTLAHNTVTRKALIQVGELKSSIQTINWAWLEPGKSFEPHTHNDCEEIYYFMTGSGEMKINNMVINIKAGDLILIEMGEARGLANTGNNRQEFITIRAKV